MSADSNAIKEAMARHKIYFESELGKVGVDVYHPFENLVALMFYPDSVMVGEDSFEDLSMAISYPNNYSECKIALRELEDIIDSPMFNYYWLTLNSIVENKERYFR